MSRLYHLVSFPQGQERGAAFISKRRAKLMNRKFRRRGESVRLIPA